MHFVWDVMSGYLIPRNARLYWVGTGTDTNCGLWALDRRTCETRPSSKMILPLMILPKPLSRVVGESILFLT